ncbi:hypothetical protein TELCIR_25697 [Teladorsagia circumcincta]|uniref:Uncharacterized protein n=1 Tax=Teladorsagia circumcincta TaxID=45464 RepID=A0A2G9T4Y4_TELCI|nr:hypothetical protein TELCIR_25697 [Teladorsagia circumcincta]
MPLHASTWFSFEMSEAFLNWPAFCTYLAHKRNAGGRFMSISMSYTPKPVSINDPEPANTLTSLGGDPFADPIWIPTLDICKINCDKDTEYCVENEELKQQCKKMPEECIQLLQEKQMVNKFFDE